MKTRLLPLVILLLLLDGCSPNVQQDLQRGTATAQMKILDATWAAIMTTTAAAPTRAPDTPTPAPKPTATATLYVSSPSTDYLVFNLQKTPFDQLCARQAFALAIDRQALIKSLNDSKLQPATTFVPPGVWPDGKSRYGKYGMNFDPARARQIMAICPALTNPGPDPIEFIISVDNPGVAENIQAQLKANLGLEVKINTVASGNLLSMTRSNPPSVYYFGWYADYNSPYNFLNDALEGRVKWSNAQYTQLVEAAKQETDPAKQTQEFEAAERILVEGEVVIVPLFHY